jgi:hypothetical protein
MNSQNDPDYTKVCITCGATCLQSQISKKTHGCTKTHGECKHHERCDKYVLWKCPYLGCTEEFCNFHRNQLCPKIAEHLQAFEDGIYQILEEANTNEM